MCTAIRWLTALTFNLSVKGKLGAFEMLPLILTAE